MAGVNDTRDIYVGFFASLGGHVALILFLYGFFSNSFKFPEEIVYSVTIEGGTALGGVSQVGQEEKKTEVPYKKVEEAKSKPVQEKEKADVVISSEKKEVKKPEKEKKEEKNKKDDPVKKPEKTKPKEDPDADNDKKYQQAMKKWLGESSDAGGKGYGAAKITGERGGGGGTLRPPEFFIYKKQIEDKIKGGWNWFDTSAALVAKVVFDIADDGTVSNIRIDQGSGNLEYDDSVERAVAKANPLPPPPASVIEFFRSVRMTFDPRE